MPTRAAFSALRAVIASAGAPAGGADTGLRRHLGARESASSTHHAPGRRIGSPVATDDPASLP